VFPNNTELVVQVSHSVRPALLRHRVAASVFPSVDNIVISRSSFLNVQNTLKILGFTQGNVEEDIIRNGSYLNEVD
jgi:hypothetical protein